jgi:hypothetical protein
LRRQPSFCAALVPFCSSGNAEYRRKLRGVRNAGRRYFLRAHGGTPLAFVALDKSGYFKLKSEDREAKTKKVVRNVRVDPEGITTLGGLCARKMPAASWFSIPKKPTRHVLERQDSKDPEGTENFNAKDVT